MCIYIDFERVHGEKKKNKRNKEKGKMSCVIVIPSASRGVAENKLNDRVPSPKRSGLLLQFPERHFRHLSPLEMGSIWSFWGKLILTA